MTSLIESEQTGMWYYKELHEDWNIFSRSWFIHAPPYHPLWHQYVTLLYDLTTSWYQGAPRIYMEGVTHEVMVYALDPALSFDQETVKGINNKSTPITRLEPPNHGYQFKAESNEAADNRIQQIVEDIIAGNVSPDTDFTRQWDMLFSDGVTLKRR